MTRARLRGGAILAALKNRKVLDMRVDPQSPCVSVPYGCNRLKLSLDMKPRPHLRVSGLGLHAIIERSGIKHAVCVPWHAIIGWRAC
jgi:hypothetical protein